MPAPRRPQPPSSARGASTKKGTASDSGFTLTRPSTTGGAKPTTSAQSLFSGSKRVPPAAVPSTSDRRMSASAVVPLTSGVEPPRFNSNTAALSSSMALGASAPLGDEPLFGSTSVENTNRWRSQHVHLEVALKELVSDGPQHPPDSARIERVLGLYDDFVKTVPRAAGILRLFRVEFCRAIFASITEISGELGKIPYFERIETISREKAILQAELAAVEADNSTDDLKKQVGKLQSLLAFYEHEVARLTKDNKKLNEEISRMASDIDATARQHQIAFTALDGENHKLTRENRELQLQVFKLSKETREQIAGQSMYQHLKQSKLDALQHMYRSGNEAASLLLLLHQLEAQVNRALDEMDLELFKASSAELSSVRAKLVKRAGVLLEEFHSVQRRFFAIDGEKIRKLKVISARGVPSQPVQVMEAANAMESEQRQGKLVKAREVEASAKAITNAEHELSQSQGPPSPSRRGTAMRSSLLLAQPSEESFMGTRTVPDKAEDAATKLRREWSEAFATSTLVDRGDNFHLALSGGEEVKTERVMHKELVMPLLDISANKFATGIELHAQSSGESQFLRNVAFVDPAVGIELPPRATHVRLKYQNPMVRPATKHPMDPTGKPLPGVHSSEVANVAVDDLNDPRTIMEWLPRATGFEDIPPVPADTEAGHWAVFRRTFLGYSPYLPRFPEVHHVDAIMVQVFEHHNHKIITRFDSCHELAISRSTGTQMAKMLAERFFRDEYRSLDVQIAMVEVLEQRYVFPELVMKVMYEMLYAMERHATNFPYTKTYLSCLSGQTPPSSGHVLALNMHLLASFWPLSTSEMDDAISERDLASVMRYLYTDETSIKINIEEMINDINISCRGHLSLRKVKEHFSLSILSQKEPMVAKLNDLLMFRASSVHWAELEFNDFWETTKAILLEDSQMPAYVRFLYCTSVLQKSSRVPPAELAFIAAEILWDTLKKHRQGQ